MSRLLDERMKQIRADKEAQNPMLWKEQQDKIEVLHEQRDRALDTSIKVYKAVIECTGTPMEEKATASTKEINALRAIIDRKLEEAYAEEERLFKIDTRQRGRA